MAIWYRHWLEVRFTAIVVLLAAVGTTYNFDRQLTRLLVRFETTGRLPRAGAEWFQSLLEAYTAREVIPLIAHADAMVMLMWVCALFLCGTTFHVNTLGGYGTGAWSASSAALQYTLALPLSRTTLMRTRLGAGALVALAGLVVAYAGNAAVLAWRGLPLLPGPAAVIAVVAFVAALFWMATIGLLMLVLGPGWAMGVSVIGMMLSIALVGPGMAAAAADRSTLFAALSLGTLLTAAVLWLSTETAKAQEV